MRHRRHSNSIANFFEHASGKKIFRASSSEDSCAASLKPSKAQARSSVLSGFELESRSAAASLHEDRLAAASGLLPGNIIFA